MRHGVMIARLLLPVALLSCGGGGKDKTPKKPVVKDDKIKPPPPKETEADREKKRRADAIAIIPDGTSCLPTFLREATAPRLDLAAVTIDEKSEAVVCANDTDKSRLLGPIACWKVDLASGGLAYLPAAKPLPGHGITVKLDDGCARAYCLPKAPGDKVGHMAWNGDNSKVAVLAGDEVHLFDANDKTRYSGFQIRGDKGVTGEVVALHWVDESIFVEGLDAVWVFKVVDGTAQGAIEALGEKTAKALSPRGGSFSTLDNKRVAIAEQGFSTITTYDVDSGKRTKIIRKVAQPPCKKPEIDAYWAENGEVSPKCKDFMTKNFGYFNGADALAGKTSLLVLLRGARLGELGVLDAKNLTEKKSIKLQWCEPGGGASNGAGDDAGGAAAADDKPPPKPKGATRAPTKKSPPKKGNAKEEDPDAGGQ